MPIIRTPGGPIPGIPGTSGLCILGVTELEWSTRPILRRAQTSKFSISSQLYEVAMNALRMRNNQFANQLHFFWFV
jgi:hypothetical protein